MAGIFAVASELSRRGYYVGLTIGNTPRIDLICAVPDGHKFTIQVKGISRKAPFWVQKHFLMIQRRTIYHGYPLDSPDPQGLWLTRLAKGKI